MPLKQIFNGFTLGFIYALDAAMNSGMLETIITNGEICLICACLSNIAPACHKRSSVKH
ncbi:MAG: hypothetical protein Q7U71_05800 [bacterium]|nr:hypothetical protein [bacterium]